jgi:hypothetical protein
MPDSLLTDTVGVCPLTGATPEIRPVPSENGDAVTVAFTPCLRPVPVLLAPPAPALIEFCLPVLAAWYFAGLLHGVAAILLVALGVNIGMWRALAATAHPEQEATNA